MWVRAARLVGRRVCRLPRASPHACLLDSRGAVCGADVDQAGAKSPGVQLSLWRPRVSGGFCWPPSVTGSFKKKII